MKVIVVAGKEAERCLDPEGNGVNTRGENGGGPGPPDGEQHKQLISSRGGGNTFFYNVFHKKSNIVQIRVPKRGDKRSTWLNGLVN